MVTFGLSAFLEKKIRPVDIQNATLAGGVTIGASANFSLGPAGALLTGMLAGLLSTFGFSKVQGFLEDKSLHDSCGVHNLHGTLTALSPRAILSLSLSLSLVLLWTLSSGLTMTRLCSGMPSVLGAVISAVFLMIDDAPSAAAAPSGDGQVGAQLIGVVVTVAVAIL